MLKKIWNEIVYWLQLLLLPVYFFSCFVPRSKKIWVFGSSFGRRFSDNPKYFYLYLRQYHQEQVLAVWISKNREAVDFLRKNGLRAYFLYSIPGIWYSLRGKVYLYDNYSKDICFALSAGAVKINLWHGIPLKKIQKDNIFDKFRNPDSLWQWLYAIPRRMSDEKPSHYVLTTSEFLKPIFSSAFHTGKVLICGYPRNEFLITDHIKDISEYKDMEFAGKLRKLVQGQKLVFYMPTFRETENKFFDCVSIEEFNDFLELNQMVFCIKLHPKSKLQNRFQQINAGRILLAEAQADPYPILKMADILVTDYSSIYFDFLLTEKPVIFFPYDYKEYIENSRELYFEYNKFATGQKAYSQKELEQALVRARNCAKEYQDEAGAICNLVYDHTVREASETLYSMIKKILK